jgi:hypothetical protein
VLTLVHIPWWCGHKSNDLSAPFHSRDNHA